MPRIQRIVYSTFVTPMVTKVFRSNALQDFCVSVRQ